MSNVFDIAEGERLKEEGHVRAISADTFEDWCRILLVVSRAYTDFTSDDFWIYMDRLPRNTKHRIALGSVFRKLHNEGLIEQILCPTCGHQEQRQSQRPEQHRNWIKVWKAADLDAGKVD